MANQIAKVNKELLARLKQALRYLDHPDVRAIPFAQPAEICAKNCEKAIENAEKLSKLL